MRLGLAVLLLAWASTAGAQQIIWKCKGPKGSLVFQNAPCSPGTAASAKVYDTPDRSEARAERERNESIMEQRNHRLRPAQQGYAYSSTSGPSDRDKQKALCRDARGRARRAAFDGTPDALRAAYERAAIDACFGL